MVSAGGEPVLPELHSAPERFLCLSFARWTRRSTLGVVAPKNEDLRFTFREHELGRHSAVPIILERHRSRKNQSQIARLECRSVSPYPCIVALSSIVESWAASYQNAYCSPNAADAAVYMAIRGRFGG